MEHGKLFEEFLNADLGKVLNLPTFGGLPQWAVVGKCGVYID